MNPFYDVDIVCDGRVVAKHRAITQERVADIRIMLPLEWPEGSEIVERASTMPAFLRRAQAGENK